MNKLLSSTLLISFGLVAGYFLQPFVNDQLQSAGLTPFGQDSAEGDNNGQSSEDNILYWVAPMDANYRRDKPGKSPMGMDLVPVYADEGSEDGVVKISPVVQNNLGVRIDTVSKGKFNREISTVGYIAFDEEKLFHLHTRVEGWVEKLDAKSVGAQIKKGQKLFELYSPTLVNAQEEYLTALKSNNKILINASRDRLISLGVSKQHADQLDRTRKVQQRIDYFARSDGFIENLNIREGMFIKPAMDVLTIGQIDTVWVIAEVFERQSGWVSKGQSVDMTVASYPGKTWQGVVDYIYPVLEPKTRTLRVRIRFENPDQRLKPNMFSRLTIHSKFNADTLFVKREAIIRNGQMERVVKALGDGKFQSVAVKTGSESGDFIEIIKGLNEGDRVVTSAQFLIDSESSLSASFERMQEPMAQEKTMMATAEPPKNKVWIDGEVTNVMAGHSMLTISHPAVTDWGWPAMVMDFPVDKGISLNSIKAKQGIRFQVEKHENGSIKVIAIDGLDKKMAASKKLPDNQVWIDGKVSKLLADNKLTIAHPAVSAWGWPAMVMDFPVDESLPLNSIKPDQSIRFLVEKYSNGSIKIIDIDGLDKKAAASKKMPENQAWIKGKILNIMQPESKLTLQHGPVKAWRWPSMEMDFPVSTSLSLKSLKINEQYHFLVEKHSSGSIEIIQMNKEGQQ